MLAVGWWLQLWTLMEGLTPGQTWPLTRFLLVDLGSDGICILRPASVLERAGVRGEREQCWDWSARCRLPLQQHLHAPPPPLQHTLPCS